jgi:hypothetical protein
MRWLALILLLVLGFGQRPAPVAPSDLNGDGMQEQVYMQQVRPSVPGSYDEGIMPQPKVCTLSFSDLRNVVHAMVGIPSTCSGIWTGTDDLVKPPPGLSAAREAVTARQSPRGFAKRGEAVRSDQQTTLRPQP